MTNSLPPLLGFNNNVRHRGRVFHIQTEDSGIKNPRIVTHLFVDGGRIIKTARTDYAEQVGRADMPTFVRGMMKEQHKAMFVALRDGELDELLENACGPFELPRPSIAGPPVSLAPESAPRHEVPEIAALPTVSPLEVDMRPAEEVPTSAETPASKPPPIPLRNKPPPIPRRTHGQSSAAPPPSSAKADGVSRPSANFAAAPSKTGQSIFGDGVITEKSLDDVILSYLADDGDRLPK